MTEGAVYFEAAILLRDDQVWWIKFETCKVRELSSYLTEGTSRLSRGCARV
jgi:hypothetical protein